MKIYLTAQTIKAIVLVTFSFIPIVTWGEARENSTLDLSLESDPERIENLNRRPDGEVTAYKNTPNLSLPLTEESMSLDLSISPDWKGLKKDTAYFLAYQFSVIGVLYVMPTSISSWTAEDKADFSMQKYIDNASQIVWDKDDWWINYVLHPYWGGTYYVRAQERGFGPLGSFLYSATLSSVYEFGAEAFFEEPSIQDLIVTPVAGYFVGKYFSEVRANIQKKKKAGPLSAFDTFVMVMTDPMGAMNAKVDKWFSKEAHTSVRLMLGPQFRSPVIDDTQFDGTRQLSYIGKSDFGLKISLKW